MKIGIITVCDNWGNYGAALQMYALKLCLEDMGHEVFHIVPQRSETEFYRNIQGLKRACTVRKDENLKILRYLRRRYLFLKYYLYFWKKQKKYEKIFNDVNFITIEQAEFCDVFVIGSDEVWNVNNDAVGSPFFFGEGVQKRKKVGYAICSGNSTYDDYLTKKYPLQLIKDVESIAVRDNISKELIEKSGNKECVLVCDPTFLIIKERLQTETINIKSKYLLIYAWDVNEKMRKYLVKFADEKGLLIVCAMGLCKYDFADINIDVSPFAFGNVIRNAEYVYTSTFHGSVFAILNHKKVIFEVLSNKVEFLIQQFNMDSHAIYGICEYSEFIHAIESEVNDAEIEKVIRDLRKTGLDYLVNALES